MNVSGNSQFRILSFLASTLIAGCVNDTTADPNPTVVQNPAGGNGSTPAGGQTSGSSPTTEVAQGGSVATTTAAAIGGSVTTTTAATTGGSVATTTAATTGGTTATGTATVCSGTTRSGLTSTAYAAITLGKYWVNNNVWGQDTAGVTGSQSIWSTCNNGSAIGWGSTFTWSGAENSVKSYASAVLGWHWGWKVAKATTELPVSVGTGPAINCDWRYAVTRNGTVTMNVAYDLWIHSVALTGASDEWDVNTYPEHKPTDEVMIWLYKSNGAGPISTTGSPVFSNISIAGAIWDLYEGQITNAWKVHSFVRQANADTGAAFDIQLFLKYLVSKSYLTNAKYLSSVEAGTEVFTGSGTFDVSSYSCDVQ